MKKLYINPSMELSVFNTENIIAESGTVQPGLTAAEKARAAFTNATTIEEVTWTL